MNVFLKTAIDFDMVPGPHVLPAGAPISVTGGHAWTLSTVADGIDGVRHAVRETIRAGADWIKLISSNDPVHREHDGEHTHPEFTAEELRTAVETAHDWGRKITAHAMGRRTLGWAIDAGIDSVEHGIYLDEQLATQMVKKNIALIPTVSGYYETVLARWSRGDDWIVRHNYLLEPHQRSTKIAVQTGVQIGVGTDTLGDIVEEMEMLVACGMTNAQALTAATRTNARILGLDAQIGTIEPGKRADLVIVQGDPIADLSVMRQVGWVFKDGRGAKPLDINISTADETADWTSLRIVEGH
jgi:imidazolonepropionase-like amidohydrolase